MWKYAIAGVAMLVSGGIASAEYTYQPLVIPSPVTPTELMRAVDIVDSGDMLLDSRQVAARLANGSTVPQQITCPTADFTPSPYYTRNGPDVRTMNNSGITAGSGTRAADNLTVAVLSYPDGHCLSFLIPGAVGTVATVVVDDGTVYGYYWNSPTVEPGLQRFHGYRRAVDGTITLLSIPGEPNSTVYVTRADDNGNFLGYTYRNIQSDNSYTFQGFLYLSASNSYNFLDYTTGEEVWLVGWNSTTVLGIVAQDAGTVGGKAVVYDRASGTFTVLTLPTVDSVSLEPRGINMAGVFVGAYTKKIPTGDPAFPRLEMVQFKATPVAEVAPASTPATPSLQKQFGHKAWRAKPFRRIKAGRNCPIYQHLRSTEKGE